MPRNALSDVNPLALTLCKQGANRQRIFLRKTQTPTEDLVTLPAGRMPILKTADDWTVFYCVVAEPGAEEDPGLVGDQDSVDVWASEDEIRKAAHRLLKNAAFVNTVHDGDAEPDCAIVESAVALCDLTVDSATIKKGSWYVGIEPRADLRKQIDDGTIEAISLEGTGIRTPLEKANTFADVIGAQQLRDSLWRATSTLEDVIFTALRDEDEDDPKAIIRTSLQQFVDFLSPMLDAVTGDGRAALAKQLGTVVPTAEPTARQEEEMGLTEDFAALKKTTDESMTAIKDEIKKNTDATTAAVTGLVDLTGKLVERVEALSAAGAKKTDDEPTDVKTAVKKLGELADKVDSFDAELTSIATGIQKLGQGSSSQDDDGDTIRKQKSTDPLAGLLD